MRWKRLGPFAYALAFLAIVSIAVFRLPDSTISALRDASPLETDAATWAFRVIAAVAIVQALYAGWTYLRAERVEGALKSDPKMAALPTARIVSSVARNAAGMVALTVVYGLAIFLLTGRRGGFWLFVVVALAQTAWYVRQTRLIADWLARRGSPERGTGIGGAGDAAPQAGGGGEEG